MAPRVLGCIVTLTQSDTRFVSKAGSKMGLVMSFTATLWGVEKLSKVRKGRKKCLRFSRRLNPKAIYKVLQGSEGAVSVLCGFSKVWLIANRGDTSPSKRPSHQAINR